MEKSSSCPCCGDDASGSCESCGFPLQQFVALLRETQQDLVLGSAAPAPKPIMSRYTASPIQASNQDAVVVGSSRDDWSHRRVRLSHQDIADNHFAVLRQDDRVWVAWLDTNASPLFLNGKPVPASELVDRDIVQAGPFGWTYHASTQTLHPAGPMLGRSIDLDGAVPGRLVRTELHVPRGQMLAVTGPSGCGKSTLLNMLRSSEDSTESGLYYMQQRDLVHEDLLIKDQLEFVARIYGNDEVLPCDIDEALASVGLTPAHANRFPRELSGGELRRARIAAALLSKQGVVVLDEPDSGLDHETATEIIRVLRSFALRGATVIAVTHHRHVLELFDRVIELEKTPDGGKIASDVTAYPASEAPEDVQASKLVDSSFRRQFPLLLQREYKKYVSPKMSFRGVIKVPACLLMLVLVPLLFAFAISVSVPTDPDRNVVDGFYGKMQPINRLGFLTVISVIWMSASLSHLSIARERELNDHEHGQGVTWRSFLAAKSVVYSFAALIQTAVFLCLLHCIRSVWLDRSYFVHESPWSMLWIACCLFLVSIAATALGMTVSGIANRRPLIAAGILPVLMMIQILFSVPFAVSDPDVSDNMSGYRQLAWTPTDEDADQQKLPLRATSAVSYGTLSRFGDQWLRSFASSIEPVPDHRRWQFRAAGCLAIWTAIYYLIAITGLHYVSRRQRRERP